MRRFGEAPSCNEHVQPRHVPPRHDVAIWNHNAGCTVAQAKQGDIVDVHYTGRLEDGTVFDTSRERQPLRFTVGEGQVIPGFEQAVIDMEPGDSKKEELPPDQAYGPRREDMVMEVERGQLPEEVEPEVGSQLQLRLQNDQTVPVIITDVADDTITIDANHPLAGKKLIFEIELVDLDGSSEDKAQIITP